MKFYINDNGMLRITTGAPRSGHLLVEITRAEALALAKKSHILVEKFAGPPVNALTIEIRRPGDREIIDMILFDGSETEANLIIAIGEESLKLLERSKK